MTTQENNKLIREYKFRGQRVDNKEWVYGYYYQGIPETYISYIIPEWLYNGYPYVQEGEETLRFEKYFEVIPSTVGQYTGLKDKNDAEVYAGNVYEHEFDKKLLRWLVEDEGYRFAIVNIGIDGYLGKRFPVDREYYFKERVCIGNIHEHPSLLNKQP